MTEFNLDEVFTDGSVIVSDGRRYVVKELDGYERPTELVLFGTQERSGYRSSARKIIMRKELYFKELDD